MNIKQESLVNSYTPVAWVYREIIDEQVKLKTSGKIFYFCQEGICEGQGFIIDMKEIASSGLYLYLDNGTQIRVDRIITLFGIPGAAYDEYDSYANSCMECHGGDETLND